MKDGKIEEAYSEIEKYFTYITERLIKEKKDGEDIFEKYKIDVPEEIKQKMTFIKNGFIDLTFENVFMKDGYLFYDQEWYVENVPLEMILYRTIKNFYTYNGKKVEEKISKEEMFSKFNITEFLPYFEEVEIFIQKDILDENIVEEYRNQISKCYYNLENAVGNKLRNEKEYQELKNNYNELEKKYIDLSNKYNKSKTSGILGKCKRLFKKDNKNNQTK